MEEKNCRLCLEDKKLRNSHIIPKMFYNYIKKNSETGGIRTVDNPNKRLEDGLKVPFLCSECEELFSVYERYFSINIFNKMVNESEETEINSSDDSIRYFLLSIAWRCLKYSVETDKKMIESFTKKECSILKDTLEKWRIILHKKDYIKIRKIQMHIIPTRKLEIFKYNSELITNNTAIDFRVLGKENSFDYAFTYIKIPYFIFLCTVWGETKHLKQFKVGKKIKPIKSRLPKFLEYLIKKHIGDFEAAKQQMSEKQIKIIKEKAKRKKDCRDYKKRGNQT